jgi:hypothetical protein
VCELCSECRFAIRSQWGCGVTLTLWVSSVLATEVVLWASVVLLCHQILLDQVCSLRAAISFRVMMMDV